MIAALTIACSRLHCKTTSPLDPMVCIIGTLANRCPSTQIDKTLPLFLAVKRLNAAALEVVNAINTSPWLSYAVAACIGLAPVPGVPSEPRGTLKATAPGLVTSSANKPRCNPEAVTPKSRPSSTRTVPFKPAALSLARSVSTVTRLAAEFAGPMSVSRAMPTGGRTTAAARDDLRVLAAPSTASCAAITKRPAPTLTQASLTRVSVSLCNRPDSRSR